MKTIEKNKKTLIEIKKSKFYSYCFYVENVEQIKEQLENIKKEHKKASHICYAYVLACPNLEKAVDDGEPKGTAGLPILNVIKKQGLADVLIIVVRYFGGTKLGAGGLLRAYSGSAQTTLALCTIVSQKKNHTYRILYKPENKNRIEKILEENGAKIMSSKFSLCIDSVVQVVDKIDDLVIMLASLCEDIVQL